MRAEKNSLFWWNVVDKKEDLKTTTVQVKLSSAARKVVERLREDTGVPNVEAVARILEWFSGQDEDFRTGVMYRRADPMADLVGRRLGELAASKVADPEALDKITAAEALALIPLLVKRIEREHQTHIENIRELTGGPKKSAKK